MDEESNEDIDSTNDETEEVLKTEEVEETTPEVETEDVDTLKQQLADKDKQNVKLFERAKKAEGFEKQPDGSWVKVQKKSEPKAQEPSEKQDGLSSMDTIALIGAKVTEKEDIDEVMDYAKLKGLSIHEALQSNVVKTILKDKAEQRATSEATNTGVARRGTSKPSPEKILQDASAGKIPENPEDLADAWMASKLKK